MGSILTSIKKMLGITEDDINFDVDLIFGINTAFSILNQLGVGPTAGFSIEHKYINWDDYISNKPKLEFVKSYVYLKTKLIFDPPTSSAAIESINRMISELEWRINVAVESTTS